MDDEVDEYFVMLSESPRVYKMLGLLFACCMRPRHVADVADFTRAAAATSPILAPAKDV